MAITWADGFAMSLEWLELGVHRAMWQLYDATGSERLVSDMLLNLILLG